MLTRQRFALPCRRAHTRGLVLLSTTNNLNKIKTIRHTLFMDLNQFLIGVEGENKLDWGAVNPPSAPIYTRTIGHLSR